MDAPTKIDEVIPKERVEYNNSHICRTCLAEIRTSLMGNEVFQVSYQSNSAENLCNKSCASKEICQQMLQLFNEIPFNDLFDDETALIMPAVEGFIGYLRNNFKRFYYVINEDYLPHFKKMRDEIQCFSKRYQYMSFVEGLRRDFMIGICDLLLSKQKIRILFGDLYPIIFNEVLHKFNRQYLVLFDFLYLIGQALSPLLKDDLLIDKPKNISRKKGGSAGDSQCELPKKSDTKKVSHNSDEIIAEISALSDRVFSHQCYYDKNKAYRILNSRDAVEAARIMNAISEFLEKYFSRLRTESKSRLPEASLYQCHQITIGLQ